MSLSCVAASLQRPRIPTLLSAFLTLLNDRLSESIVFPLLPFLLAQFTPDGRTLGLLAGSYALAQFLVTPLIGALSDRYGRRPVISICVAGSVVGARPVCRDGFIALAQPKPAAPAVAVRSTDH